MSNASRPFPQQITLYVHCFSEMTNKIFNFIQKETQSMSYRPKKLKKHILSQMYINLQYLVKTYYYAVPPKQVTFSRTRKTEQKSLYR